MWIVAALTRVVPFLPNIDLDLFGRLEIGCAIVLLVLGLPIQFLLQRFKLNGPWITIVLGCIFGTVLGVISGYGINIRDMAPADYPPFDFNPLTNAYFVVGALFGTAHTWVAWLIRRPDRDTVALPPATKTAQLSSNF